MGAVGQIDLHDTKHKIQLLLIMTAIWTIIYTAIHLLYKPKHKLSKKVILDTKNRFVSIIHGVASFIMASYCFIFNEFKYVFIYS